MDLLVLIKTLVFLGLVLSIAYFCFILAKKKLSTKIDNKNQRIKISNYSHVNQKIFACIIHADNQEYLLISNGEALILDKINIRPSE